LAIDSTSTPEPGAPQGAPSEQAPVNGAGDPDRGSSKIADTISSYVVKQFAPDKRLMRDESLFDHGIIDSLSVVELVLFLEDSFKIRVAPYEITRENFETVGAIASLVAGKRGRED